MEYILYLLDAILFFKMATMKKKKEKNGYLLKK